METMNLFTAALGLEKPWRVSRVEFMQAEEEELELHIEITFEKGSPFSCPIEGCKENATSYDTVERTWRHLNFFSTKRISMQPCHAWIARYMGRISQRCHGPEAVQGLHCFLRAG